MAVCAKISIGSKRPSRPVDEKPGRPQCALPIDATSGASFSVFSVVTARDWSPETWKIACDFKNYPPRTSGAPETRINDGKDRTLPGQSLQPLVWTRILYANRLPPASKVRPRLSPAKRSIAFLRSRTPEKPANLAARCCGWSMRRFPARRNHYGTAAKSKRMPVMLWQSRVDSTGHAAVAFAGSIWHSSPSLTVPDRRRRFRMRV